jgi:hypothetical protein
LVAMPSFINHSWDDGRGFLYFTTSILATRASIWEFANFSD